MTDHYLDQITDLCDWLRDPATVYLLCRPSSAEGIRRAQAILRGKADQIDPAIQLEQWPIRPG
jgi:hypothetical protein